MIFDAGTSALAWPFLGLRSGAGVIISRVSTDIELTTHNVFVSFVVQGRWIWYRSFHRPAFGFIFGPYEIFNFPGNGLVSRCNIASRSFTHASEGTCPGASFASQYLYHVKASLFSIMVED